MIIKIVFDNHERQHYLEVDKECFENNMGGEIICQNCYSPISIKPNVEPFFICPETKKWFCADCELKKGDIKEFICPLQKTEDEHIHPKIFDIDIFDDNETDKRGEETGKTG